MEEYVYSVETVIHNGGLEVKKIPAGDVTLTLLKIHTPGMVYTLKLDEAGLDNLLAALRQGTGTPDIVIASPNSVPGLKG